MMDAEHFLIDRDCLLGHASRAEVSPYHLARGVSEAACSERVAKQFEHSVSQGFAVGWRYEQPRLVVPDDRVDTVDVAGDDWSSECHRLQHQSAESLTQGRQTKNVHRRQRLRQVQQVRYESDSISNLQFACQAAQVVLLGTGSGHQKLGGDVRCDDSLSGSQEIRKAFDRFERSGGPDHRRAVRFKDRTR